MTIGAIGSSPPPVPTVRDSATPAGTARAESAAPAETGSSTFEGPSGTVRQGDATYVVTNGQVSLNGSPVGTMNDSGDFALQVGGQTVRGNVGELIGATIEATTSAGAHVDTRPSGEVRVGSQTLQVRAGEVFQGDTPIGTINAAGGFDVSIGEHRFQGALADVDGAAFLRTGGAELSGAVSVDGRTYTFIDTESRALPGSTALGLEPLSVSGAERFETMNEIFGGGTVGGMRVRFGASAKDQVVAFSNLGGGNVVEDLLAATNRLGGRVDYSSADQSLTFSMRTTAGNVSYTIFRDVDQLSARMAVGVAGATDSVARVSQADIDRTTGATSRLFESTHSPPTSLDGHTFFEGRTREYLPNAQGELVANVTVAIRSFTLDNGLMGFEMKRFDAAGTYTGGGTATTQLLDDGRVVANVTTLGADGTTGRQRLEFKDLQAMGAYFNSTTKKLDEGLFDLGAPGYFLPDEGLGGVTITGIPDGAGELFGPGTDLFGPGTDLFGPGADPFGLGADPFDVGADPFDVGADPFDVGADPFDPGGG